MTLIVIYIIISFLLDGLISNYTSINIINPSYFRTIFSLIALIISFNFFDNEKKYLKILIIIGFLFDIIYTNTFLLNIVIFYILYLNINLLNNYIPNNLFTINIKSLISLTIYHILSYIILLLSNYEYPIKLLGIIITRSIISTIIYTTFSYFIMKKLYYKIYDKKIK